MFVCRDGSKRQELVQIDLRRPSPLTSPASNTAIIAEVDEVIIINGAPVEIGSTRS